MEENNLELPFGQPGRSLCLGLGAKNQEEEGQTNREPRGMAG